MLRKSFYDLNFGVSPGGARKDAHYIRGSLAEIQADLAAELAEGVNIWLLCWYGAELNLDVYEHGQRVHSIDLHPHVTISVEGHPDVTFTGPRRPTGWDFEEDEEGGLSDQLFTGELEDQTTVTVAWDRIEVPPLRGQVAVPGDQVTIGEHSAPYGFIDFES